MASGWVEDNVNSPQTRAQIEKAREARRRIEKVCDRLQRPGAEAFDACAADLGRAIECLESLEAGLAASPGERSKRGEVALEIVGLGREVGRAQALLAGAGRFLAGWARLMDTSPEAAVTSYTASGKPRVAIPIDRGKVAMDG